MAIDEVRFARLRDGFTEEWKKIEHYEHRRELPKNPNKIDEYKNNLSNKFNAICTFLIQTSHASKRVEDKLECIARIKPYIEKCKRAFVALKLQYNWPTAELALIDLNAIRSLDEQSPSPNQEEVIAAEQQPTSSSAQDIASSTGHSDTFFEAEQVDDSRIEEIIEELSNIDIEQAQINDTEQTDQTIGENSAESPEQNTVSSNANSNTSSHSNSSHNSNLNSRSNSQENLNMPQSAQDFFKLAGSVLNYKYDGDPILRDSFIEDCELVESMAEEANKAHCLKFIKSKIVGRAREMLPEKIEKVSDMTDELKSKVKADSSAVIEGRLTALRVSKGNFTKFAEEAEKLADAFRRSLIGEGFAKAKADELTIKKTKELCRRTARNESVKGIIATTVCTTPAEVIATLITESDIARKEKREQEAYQKRSQNKFKSNKYGKNNKNPKSDQKGQKKGNYHKGKNHDGQNRGRSNRNDHVNIRLVNETGTPSTSAGNFESSNNGGEQVFRLAPS